MESNSSLALKAEVEEPIDCEKLPTFKDTGFEAGLIAKNR